MTPTRVLIPVSGGKDSQACVALAVDRYGADICMMIHQNTGFDHPLTYKHMDYMSERYGVPLFDVSSDKYKTVPEVMHGEEMIPSRFARMCTRQLKTGPWFEWLAGQPYKETMLVLLGMRSAESQQRKANYGDLSPDDIFNMEDISGECLVAAGKVQVQLPIVNWTTPSVYTFLRERGDLLNPLYARGHTRVGCYPCVLAGRRDFVLAARDPVGRKHIIELKTEIEYVKAKRPNMDVTSFFDHDLDEILSDKRSEDPLNMFDDEAGSSGCSWCAI